MKLKYFIYLTSLSLIVIYFSLGFVYFNWYHHGIIKVNSSNFKSIVSTLIIDRAPDTFSRIYSLNTPFLSTQSDYKFIFSEKDKFINDSFAYQFISARIYINNLDTRNFVENYIYIPEEIIESPSKAVDYYAYGLALIKEKKYKRSILVLNHLLDFLNTKEQHLYIIKNYISIAISQAYLQSNDNDKALLILEDLNNIYPTDSSVLYFLSNAYIKNKDYKKVLDMLVPYVIEHKDHRLIIKISEAAYKLKEKSLGHEYRADYLKLLGSFNSSIKFYRLALKYNMKGKTIDERIVSKIRDIKRLQESKEIL